MARNSQTLVPTLDFLHHVSESGVWSDVLEEQGHGNVAAADSTLRAARAAGVPLALGSDSPNPDGVRVEFGRMIEHGLSPANVLDAATIGGARALGIDPIVGTIEPGKLADLVVIDGDPIAEPSLVGDPEHAWLVLRNGDPVAGTRLRPIPL
jgi:imidazolonepropionase-like amidohydrolase